MLNGHNPLHPWTIHVISHFLCFMALFHCIHLGSSRDYTSFLPYSALHIPILLYSSRLFWRLYTLFAIFSASWLNFSTFILGLEKAIIFICNFQCFVATFQCFHLCSFGCYTLYLPFQCFMVPFNCRNI